MTTIRMPHIRAAHMCASGARKFFKYHDLDWNKFLKEGIDVTEVEHIDDAMLRAVIRVAENG